MLDKHLLTLEKIEKDYSEYKVNKQQPIKAVRYGECITIYPYCPEEKNWQESIQAEKIICGVLISILD